MAAYKVIQDVEAEDKILGPLSLKQLIFAAIAAGTIFVAFKVVTMTGVIYTAIPFLPIIVVFGFLAAPIGRDQPTEMWLAAQIRFRTKPRLRIWDQSDIKRLVNITAPIREEKVYTDGLNQTQVRSRLKALASTLDSRGWAVKNADINLYATSTYGQVASDRLIDPSSLPVAVPAIDIKASDDIMDVQNNETAHHFDELMQASGQAHKDAVIAKMHKIAEQKQRAHDQQEDFWFMHQPQAPTDNQDDVMFGQNIVQPASSSDDDENNTFLNDDATAADLSDEEKQLLEHAKQEQERTQTNYGTHHKIVLTPAQRKALEEKQQTEREEQQRIAAKQRAEQDRQKAIEEQTRLTKADTIELANANDFKVSTIAGLAKHKLDEKQDPDEIVIKLH